jgi:hypothetical protein
VRDGSKPAATSGSFVHQRKALEYWVPACAGTTVTSAEIQ